MNHDFRHYQEAWIHSWVGFCPSVGELKTSSNNILHTRYLRNPLGPTSKLTLQSFINILQFSCVWPQQSYLLSFCYICPNSQNLAFCLTHLKLIYLTRDSPSVNKLWFSSDNWLSLCNLAHCHFALCHTSR